MANEYLQDPLMPPDPAAPPVPPSVYQNTVPGDWDTYMNYQYDTPLPQPRQRTAPTPPPRTAPTPPAPAPAPAQQGSGFPPNWGAMSEEEKNKWFESQGSPVVPVPAKGGGMTPLQPAGRPAGMVTGKPEYLEDKSFGDRWMDLLKNPKKAGGLALESLQQGVAPNTTLPLNPIDYEDTFRDNQGTVPFPR